jgi:hypothetical protein
VVDGIVWCNEIGQCPAALVCFDPAAEKLPELADPVRQHPRRHRPPRPATATF